MSKLAEYRTPTNVIEGVWIEMPNGLRVRVTLPSQHNRKFQFAMLKAMPDDFDREDASRFDRMEASETMVRVFNEVCIKEIEDDPSPLPLDYDEYYPLISEVYSRAMEMAAEQAEKLEETVKKSKAS